MTTDVRPNEAGFLFLRPASVEKKKPGFIWARDGVFVWLSVAHAAVLLLAPSALLIGIGLWWNANTIAHNFIHRPFFRSRAANTAYSAFLSLVLGLPQRLWRARHLAHHAELSAEAVSGIDSRAHPVVRFRWTPAMWAEGALVLTMWAAIAAISPKFFLGIYLPGWTIGLGLCLLQGHFEHARGTTSHYGRIYNALFFNDGFHVEHHARPGASWAALPDYVASDAMSSRWPAVLRWLDWFNLESLERLVLRRPSLQRFVLRVHERAFRAVLPALPAGARVVIVGGGLFPRTALILRRVLPDASLVIVDANASNLEVAKARLGATVQYRHEFWNPRLLDTADVIVIPLAFQGDRRRVYERPAAPIVLVHDWIWNRRSPGTRISWLLLKRLNLVQR